MITITLQGYLTLKQQVGTRQLPVPAGSSLRDLLALLEQDLGLHIEDEPIEAGALRGQLIVLVNGVHCRHLPESLSTILKDGDQVAIFPPVAGGSGVAHEEFYPLPHPLNFRIWGRLKISPLSLFSNEGVWDGALPPPSHAPDGAREGGWEMK